MMGIMHLSLPTAWKADCAKAPTSSRRFMLPLGFCAACRHASTHHSTACAYSCIILQAHDSGRDSCLIFLPCGRGKVRSRGFADRVVTERTLACLIQQHAVFQLLSTALQLINGQAHLYGYGNVQ